jgi:hypothetical protein
MKDDYDDKGLSWWSSDQATRHLAQVGYAPLEALRSEDARGHTIDGAAYEIVNDSDTLPDPTEEGFSQLRRSVSEMIEFCRLLDEHTRLRLSRQTRAIDLLASDENESIEALRHRFRRAVIQSDSQARRLFELVKEDEDDTLISVFIGFCFGFPEKARDRLQELIERSDHSAFVTALVETVLQREPELFEIDRDIKMMVELAQTARLA